MHLFYLIVFAVASANALPLMKDLQDQITNEAMTEVKRDDQPQVYEYKRMLDDFHRNVRDFFVDVKSEAKNANSDTNPPTKRGLPCHARHGCVEGVQMVKRLLRSLFDQPAETSENSKQTDQQRAKRCLPWEGCYKKVSDESEGAVAQDADTERQMVARAVQQQLKNVDENIKQLLDLNQRSVAAIENSVAKTENVEEQVEGVDEIVERAVEEQLKKNGVNDNVNHLLGIDTRSAAIANSIAEYKDTIEDSEAKIENAEEPIDTIDEVVKRRVEEQLKQNGVNQLLEIDARSGSAAIANSVAANDESEIGE